MRLRWTATLALTLMSMGNALGGPDDGRPRGTYLPVEPALLGDAPLQPQQSGAGLILYLNRCEGGETLTPGPNDSRTNRSSIVRRTATLPPYPYSDESWRQVVQCVRNLYAFSGVTVVDQEPAPTQTYDEAMVCGGPSDLNLDPRTGGVAPFACRVIPNAITFTFPELYGNWPRGICETIAQESAHAWGLDHQFLCEDPMTYLTDCGDKSFQDRNVPCGEYEARACQCGGSTQNSYQRIKAIWGGSTPTPPTLSIVRPGPGQAVSGRFAIEVAATDDNGMRRVSVYIDGTEIAEGATPPYIFNGPDDLPRGAHVLEAEAEDVFGATTRVSIQLSVGGDCSDSSECPDTYACVAERCVPGPTAAGGLGTACTGGDECVSGVCGEDSAGTNLCTDACEVGAAQCPSGFECRTTGSGGSAGVCWPADGGGGCRAAPEDPAPWGAFALAGLALALLRRRRA